MTVPGDLLVPDADDSPNRHFSQGLIFAGSDGAEPAWRVVFRQEVVIEAVRRLRGGDFFSAEVGFSA